MPKLDREQRKIVRLIRKEGRHIRDPRKRRVYERAAVQTGLVESGLRNLDYGDADSQGWRQERASLYPNPTNVKASVRRFRQEFEQHYDPGEKSYEVAAQVQRPREDLRGRYREEAPAAAAILKRSSGGRGLVEGGRGLRRDVQTRNRYDTIPGVDNSDQRQAAMLNYLDSERGKPGAILGLQAELEGAADVPARRVLVGRDRTVTKTRGRGGTRTGRTAAKGGSATGIVNDISSWAQSVGLPAGSRDRDVASNRAVGGSGDSDHLEGGGQFPGREAIDIPAAGESGWKAYRRAAKRLGLRPDPGGFTEGTIRRGNKQFRVQVIFGDAHDHGDHVHVGVRRV